MDREKSYLVNHVSENVWSFWLVLLTGVFNFLVLDNYEGCLLWW